MCLLVGHIKNPVLPSVREAPHGGTSLRPSCLYLSRLAELGDAAGLYTNEAVSLGVLLSLGAAGGWALGIVGPNAPGLPEEGRYIERLQDRQCGSGTFTLCHISLCMHGVSPRL